MSDEPVGDNGVPDAAEERRVRFGRLPGPVPASEQVESVETDPPRDLPEPAGDEREWPLRWAGGG